MNIDLVRKYNVPGPRYTSYPTVPLWNPEMMQEAAWKSHVKKCFEESNSSEGISLYLHLPYCESLCTYCGCNTRITVNHKVEHPYIETILAEWRLYLALFGSKPRIRELHLGGGTPTFFSPENLKYLIDSLLENCEVTADAEFGFEGHPNSTNREHLQTLYDLGFRRVSFGIQDFDPVVQEIVNRKQSFAQVESVTRIAREIGYNSINYDLIYGLPLQQASSILDTMEKVGRLMPDRIALYSYAHVPWVKPGQRKFTELDLPDNEVKRTLYELGKEMLEEMGYFEIGMDHFALEHDALYEAAQSKKLHRNFMGYTPVHTRLSIGLGASSISDSWTAFAQNLKKVEDYTAQVNEGKFPIFRGHKLSEEDQVIRRHILNLMCHYETEWSDNALQHPVLEDALTRLKPMMEDGLVRLSEHRIEVLPKGFPFVRNVCMAVDPGLSHLDKETPIFSRTV